MIYVEIMYSSHEVLTHWGHLQGYFMILIQEVVDQKGDTSKS